jgi:hypothetical protein
MPSTIAQSVGVDIAKDTLDAHLHPAGAARRFANTRKGRSDLIAWLAGFTVGRIVFEPTGPYHHAFERELAEAGLPLAKSLPSRRRGSTRVRLVAVPRRSVGILKPTPSMPPCSPTLPLSSSRQDARPRARRSIP